jgi:transcription elongation factor Elf1
VVCDRKISAQKPGEATFYRVKDTNGWIFDIRGDQRLAHEISEIIVDHETTSHEGGWTVEFVRGCAAAARKGIEEIALNAPSRVISFRHPDGARINIYYTTKTIGSALAHPTQGSTQLFRRNCTNDELIEILKNPRLHTGHGYHRTSKRSRTDVHPDAASSRSATGLSPFATVQDLNMEEDFRNRVKDLDQEIKELMEERESLWRSIHGHEAKRVEENKDWWKQWAEHDGVLKAEQAAQAEALRAQEEERQRALRAQEEERQRAELLRQRTCNQCGRVFVNPTAMYNHIRDTHQNYTCGVCGRSCKNRNALNQHIHATGHW